VGSAPTAAALAIVWFLSHQAGSTSKTVPLATGVVWDFLVLPENVQGLSIFDGPQSRKSQQRREYMTHSRRQQGTIKESLEPVDRNT
jgi:hypothetical protein